jgi:hypothetical protein
MRGTGAASPRRYAAGGRRTPPRIVIVLLFSVLLALPSTATATDRPDLVVTQIIVKELQSAGGGPKGGGKHYLAVDESDDAPTFTIKVTVKNIGTATAGSSKVFLRIEENLEGPIFEKTEPIGPLTPGMYRRATFTIEGLHPHLGVLIPLAYADDTHKIAECPATSPNCSHETNNHKVGRAIMVVARRWKIGQFQTLTKLNAGPGQTDQGYTAAAPGGLVWKLARFDEKKELFEYKASGQLNGGEDRTGGCTYHGKDSKSEDPWPGQLWLNDNLDGYNAKIHTEQLPKETATLYCAGFPVGPMPWKWQDLDTFLGKQPFPKMVPDDTQLQDTHTESGPSGSTKWDWTFNADVVYKH